MNKDEVFKIIQKFLKNPPTVIWGSGATIPYGLPSMDDFKDKLKTEMPQLSSENNLEIEIGKIRDSNKINLIKKTIWKIVYEKDRIFFKALYKNRRYAESIKIMIEKFNSHHPEILNIITTNYDRVLEYVLAINGHSFTDGFSGQNLSLFNETNFKKKKIINVLKVHGSLNWFEVDEKIVFISDREAIDDKDLNPLIISPSTQKYEEAYKEPFRTLIHKSDNIIKDSKSFFVVGFGFNDEHLTPKIYNKIKEGVPIIIIVKKASENCLKKLEQTQNFVLIEDYGKDESKVSYRRKDDQAEGISLEGQYWILENFIKEVI